MRTSPLDATHDCTAPSSFLADFVVLRPMTLDREDRVSGFVTAWRLATVDEPLPVFATATTDGVSRASGLVITTARRLLTATPVVVPRSMPMILLMKYLS